MSKSRGPVELPKPNINIPKITENFSEFEKPRVIMDNGKVLTLHGTCPVTMKGWSLENVPRDGYYRFMNGEPISSALKKLPEDQQELILTGITQAGWDALLSLGKDEAEKQIGDTHGNA